MTDKSKYLFRNVAVAIAVVLFLGYAATEIYVSFLKPVANDKRPKESPIPTRKDDERESVPESVAPIDSLSIDTNYVGYFSKNDKCRRSYTEMFGDKTGVFSENSACNVTVTFGRNGEATRMVVIKRFEPATTSWKILEQNELRGRVTVGDFEKLAAVVAGNEAFRFWNDGMSVTARNTSVIARYADGSAKSPMSNVDDKTTVFLAMIEAFRELDARTDWK